MAPLPSAQGVARTLYSWWSERRDGVATDKGTSGETLEQVYGGGRELSLTNVERANLEGAELESYQEWLATQQQLQTTTNALETSVDAVEEAESESDTDSEDDESEQQGKALNISVSLGAARKKIGLSDEDLGVNILIRRKGVHDYDVRGKKGRERMFPLSIKRRRIDEFGELIRPEDYLRAEERDDTDGVDMRADADASALGKKRKWDNAASKNDKRSVARGNKRQQTGPNSKEDGLDALLNDTAFVNDIYDEDAIEAEMEDTSPVRPSKAVYSQKTITVNSRLAFVDFSGLHDKRSLAMLIPLIAPRKLILVAGQQNETLALANDCKRLLAALSGGNEGKGVDVYTPLVGDTVEASVDTNAWAVVLGKELVKRLRWQRVKGLGIVTITGRLEAANPVEEEGKLLEAPAKKLKIDGEEADGEKEGEDEKKDEMALVKAAAKPEQAKPSLPVLDIVPTTMASATRSVAQPLHVGDLRLADLRKLMIASGYTAEFRGEGTLLINSCVAVRKLATGRIEVESVASRQSMAAQGTRDTFFAVRSKIYEGLAVVAGG
jgi:cleavage and polyadenylation specificity factor subunit 2